MILMKESGKTKNFKIYQSSIRGLYECICFNNHKHCHSCVHDSDYKTPKSLQITSPFHRAVLEQYLDKLYTFAPRFIDSEYGRIHNNWCEYGFQQIWASGIKRNRISADHWKMSGFIGLLNSNQTPMYDIMGVDYCWQLWVLAQLNCEILPMTATYIKKMNKIRKLKLKRKSEYKKKIIEEQQPKLPVKFDNMLYNK